ncbi:SagF family protein [Streptococcus canis]|uniref:SagF family protein n=1 Tax=Streptococcus canis TaxID=1329 RepID=UPI0013883AAC|nr:SagF family protein [Streptococcus canis]GFG42746.1 hypothetical protein ScFU29_16500 [Streptococcus canis]
MMVVVLVAVLSLITLWLTSHRRRRLVRWHFKWIRILSYQNWLDVLLGVVQFALLLVVLFLDLAGLRLGDVLTFLGQVTWQWGILSYLLLYLLSLVEMTLLTLVLIFDVGLQKDSRLLFQKLTWLAFKQEKPITSLLLLSFVVLADSVFYLGLLFLLGKGSLMSLSVLVLGYALVKACRYSGWLNCLLAFCLFTVIGIWAVTATLLYGWLIGLLLLTLTYLMISFKEQR